MRNNKNKGFTLVELLVVIAILAILSTVAVVGYTSFIESATISNDESLAAQLNNFLVAYNQQNFGSPATDKIDEDNIRDITSDILALGGLDKLLPQAEKYGYHFYYDLKENKYVVLHDDEAMGIESALTQLIKAFAEDGAEEVTFVKRAGNSFTVGGRYFLVDTDGLYGSLINSVYDFNGNKDDLALLYTETVANFTSTDGVAIGTAIQKAMEDIVYITDSGTFVISVADTHTLPIANVTEGETVVNIINIKTDITGATSSVTQDAPLASVSGNVTIELPGNVKIFGDSLNIIVEEGASVTIVVNADSWDDVQMDASFTNSDVVLELNGKEYTLQSDKIVNDKNETVKENLTYGNPMKEFDLLLQDLSNKKVHTVINTGNSNNVGYMAWNEGKIILQPTEIVGNDGSSVVSSTGVVLSVDDSVKDYVTISNNVITIKDINNDGKTDRADYLAFAEKFETFTVTAKSVVNAEGVRVEAGVDSISATATIKVVKVAGASLSMKGDESAWTSGSTVLLTYDKDVEKQYIVSVFGSTYNHPEAKTEGYIELDEAISLSTVCNDPVCCIHEASDHVPTSAADCKHNASSHSRWDASGGIGQYWVCDACPSYNPADPQGHWCYYTMRGTVLRTGDCGGACKNDNSKHTHTTKCCSHVHTTQTDCIECLGNHNNLVLNGASVTTTGEGKFVLTVTVDNLTIEKLVNISVMDFSNIPVRVNPALAHNEIYIGNLNSIKASDLFATRDGNTYVKEGYILKIYEGSDPSALVDKTGTVADTDFSVNNNSIVLSNGMTDVITFANTTGNLPITMALFTPDGTTRVSEELTVHVVNAANVRDYNEFKGYIDTDYTNSNGVKTHPLKNSIVLLGYIEMPYNKDILSGNLYNDDNHFAINSGKALYGNYFTINVKEGRETQQGIIDLNGGLIRDVRIIGAVYPDFAGSVSLQYGSSAVSATGNGSTIENCYIANTRSPLRINGGTVVVKDTILFGGRYSNIDMTGGTLKVQGTVTTVQQEYDGVIGVGISGWFNDNTKSIILEDIKVGDKTIEADLVQYNFLSSTLASNNKLPTISFLGTEILNLNTPFQEIFNSQNAQTYGKYVFTVNGVQYANAMAVATDKYMLSYEVSISGSTVTVTMKPGVSASNMSFDIVYDSSKYSEVGAEGREDTTLNDGVMHITGAALSNSSSSYATYTFTLNSGSFDKFDFKVTNVKDANGVDAFKTLNVTDDLGYKSIDYNFNKILPLASTDGTNNYYSKGIRYNKISAEIYSVQQDNAEYIQRLNEYLAMGNYYTPDGDGSQFDATSGTLTNYWETVKENEVSK
ncbi:MAG: prepilin-type N-terminal cleavage/methylation domain-containing protein [Lachnospiraceae bacterium]|nr:prepilin-type N-terminal cleavage/methylation domain-containing protein [Lachnospiraceae bacterium]